MSRLQNGVLRHVLWEIELGALDLAEGALDDLPEDVADGWGAVQGAVEVPAAEVEFGGDGVHFGVCEGVGGGGVGFAVALGESGVVSGKDSCGEG
jgi:hypothetical protein